MANGWVKALYCRSNATSDVHLLPRSCRTSSHSLKHSLLLLKKPKPKPKPTDPLHSSSPPPPIPSPFPTLSELPPHHPSRRVIELIFSSSWSRPSRSPFPGEIHLLYRVHNPSKTISRFEDYRRAVTSLAGDRDPRCAADGNEMLRFCPPSSWPHAKIRGMPICQHSTETTSARLGGAIRTFTGSGGAHRSASGGDTGARRSRAMLVCRVIAGRIRPESDYGSSYEYESVDMAKGELLVLDPRAVLPCFLIIYKV